MAPIAIQQALSNLLQRAVASLCRYTDQTSLRSLFATVLLGSSTNIWDGGICPLQQQTVLPCLAVSQLAIADNNITTFSSTLVRAGEPIHINGGQAKYCAQVVVPEVDVCRVNFDVRTSFHSSTYVEIWLPFEPTTQWNGRIVATGNTGLDGCVDYGRLVYSTKKGFVAVGDNGGHHGHGANGEPFLHHDQVILDFSYRGRHVSIQYGKQAALLHYYRPVTKSYHWACSTGGRQGLQAAQMYPEDFDGIVAGAPAIDFNHLASWAGHFLTITGSGPDDPRFLVDEEWQAVHNEVTRQCDGALDGVYDGIIEDPSRCNFNPEYLLCTDDNNYHRSQYHDNNSDNKNQRTMAAGEKYERGICLTVAQVETVRLVFTPLYGLNNRYIYPRLSPGTELIAARFPFASLNGHPGLLSTGWYRNAVYNNPHWDPRTLNALDYEYADSLDSIRLGNISSWKGDLGEFKRRGGKILMYHGTEDPLITVENSRRYYLHVAASTTLADVFPVTTKEDISREEGEAGKGADKRSLSVSEMDEFFRYFPISGMSHCATGNGAWSFGQDPNAPSRPPITAISSSPSLSSSPPSSSEKEEQQGRGGEEDILDKIVNWVEFDDPPDRILGTKFIQNDPRLGVDYQREHCRFPWRTTYVGPPLSPLSSPPSGDRDGQDDGNNDDDDDDDDDDGNGKKEWKKLENWKCVLITDWDVCSGPGGTVPILC